MLGNGRVLVKCYDEVVRVGHIRGKMKRKVWIAIGDLVLCSLREFQNKKCDVILKYLPDEIRQLKAQNLIPETVGESDAPSEGIEFVDNLEELSQSSSDSDSESDSDSDGEDFMKKKIEEKKGAIDIDDIWYSLLRLSFHAVQFSSIIHSWIINYQYFIPMGIFEQFSKKIN